MIQHSTVTRPESHVEAVRKLLKGLRVWGITVHRVDVSGFDTAIPEYVYPASDAEALAAITSIPDARVSVTDPDGNRHIFTLDLHMEPGWIVEFQDARLERYIEAIVAPWRDE